MTVPTRPLAVLTGVLRVQMAVGRFNATVKGTDGATPTEERYAELNRLWEGLDLTATVYILEAAEKVLEQLTGEETA